MTIKELTIEIPTEPGWYWIKKPGMKHLFRIELKLKDGKLFISGEPAYGGMVMIADYPLDDCKDGTEWMTAKEGDKYF